MRLAVVDEVATLNKNVKDIDPLADDPGQVDSRSVVTLRGRRQAPIQTV